MFQPVVFQGEAIDERLGDRLNREELLAIADLEHLPIGGGDGDAEPAAVGFGQLGDVVGHLAFIDGGVAGVEVAKHVAERRGSRLHLSDQKIDFVVGSGGGHAEGSGFRVRGSGHRGQRSEVGHVTC